MNITPDKIVLLHWIGRFGNRMFQYAFGCSYAKRFNCIFYIPSEWEGSIIFKPNKYCRLITDATLCLDINNSAATDEIRKQSLYNYNNRTGDKVEYVSFDNKKNIGKVNVAFDDLHCMYFQHCYDLFEQDFLQEIYTFNDAVLNSDMYKWYDNNKHTQDVCHLRRGDIAELNFNGAHSMISKASYIKQLDLLGIDKSNVIWLSESKIDRSENMWNNKSRGHNWAYPNGEKYCPDIFLDFLPDLLSMIFARTLLRGNSSLSWWGAFLSVAKVYSPVIKPKPVEHKNKYYCLETEFEPGNASHFMGSKLDADFFNDIIIPVKNKYHTYKAFYLKYVKFINMQPQKNKKILSFSLYDTTSTFSNSRGFYKGIYVNYHLAKTLYPDWIIRIYMPYNEPAHIINELSQFTDIELVLIDTNICLRALRFLPHDDENVSVWLSRDLDSIVNAREKVAVNDWLTNYPDKELHIMTDHQQHQWTIAGGMFGFRNNIKTSSLIDFTLRFSTNISNNNNYAIDCDICEKFFYKEDNYIQHYGAGKKLISSKPFPEHKPIDYDFVGCVVDINSYYGRLNLRERYHQLCNKKTIQLKSNDLFYYPPWNANCIVNWYSAVDFTLTPIKSEKSTCGNNSSLKTERGEGVKLVTDSSITISVLWDGTEKRNVYISDENTLAIVHGNEHYYFTRV
jgi:hypothetical protein